MGGTAKGWYAHPHTVPALASVNCAVIVQQLTAQFTEPRASQLRGRSLVCLVLFLKIPIGVNGRYGQGTVRSPHTVPALGSVNRAVRKKMNGGLDLDLLSVSQV